MDKITKVRRIDVLSCEKADKTRVIVINTIMMIIFKY